MSVEKANVSVTYDVELNDKHYSITFYIDCNNRYTHETIFDEEGNEIEEGTELYKKIIAEVSAFKEHENDNT
jgi:predicted DNA binding protein